MHIHYDDLYGHTLALKKPALGVMKYFNFGIPILGHHYYILSLSAHAPV